MKSDSSGLSDEVIAELNPAEPNQQAFDPQPAPIPDRPADGASAERWVDYVVALGADRTFLTEMTGHQDGPDAYEVIPPFKRADLIALADRLGG